MKWSIHVTWLRCGVISQFGRQKMSLAGNGTKRLLISKRKYTREFAGMCDINRTDGWLNWAMKSGLTTRWAWPVGEGGWLLTPWHAHGQNAQLDRMSASRASFSPLLSRCGNVSNSAMLRYDKIGSHFKKFSTHAGQWDAGTTVLAKISEKSVKARVKIQKSKSW